MQWVFFDCFNTLIDDFDQHGAIDGLETIAHMPVAAGAFANEAAFRHAYASGREHNWWQPAGEVHFDVRLRAVFDRSGALTPAEHARLVAAMIDMFDQTYPDFLRCTPDVHSMLQAWRGHARLAVVSNFFLPGWPGKALARFGLATYFDFVIDSAQVGLAKPDIQIYQQALALAGVAPSDVLFVGDDHHRDVLTPRALGMAARHVCRFGDKPGLAPSPEPDPVRHWREFRPPA